MALAPPGHQIMTPMMEPAERSEVRFVVVRRVLVEVRDIEPGGPPASPAPMPVPCEDARAGDRAPAVPIGGHSGSIPVSAAHFSHMSISA